MDYVEEGSSLRHLDIELPPEELSEEFEKGVNRLRRSVKLPGFRKGKIPKDVIRSRFRSDVLNQAVQDLVPHALNEALKEKNLYPLNEPHISKLESELGKPLRFRASFEVMPDIELKQYQDLEVESPSTEVTDEEIEKGIDALREENARFDPIEDRGARDHDFVMGRLKEMSKEDGKEQVHEGVSIEVGSEAYHRALHEALQGARPGETLHFDASFPPDHQQPERAGKTFEVEFELVELKEKVLPEADDELAKDLGDYDTLDELRAELKRRAKEKARHEDEQELRRRLFATLIKANPVEPPESLVEMEIDGRIEAAARDLYQRGIDPNRAGIDWRGVRNEQREAAANSVRSMLLLDAVAKREKLSVGEDEVRAEVERIAEALQKSPSAVRAQMMKDGSLERVRSRLQREKAVDFIKQHAKLK